MVDLAKAARRHIEDIVLSQNASPALSLAFLQGKERTVRILVVVIATLQGYTHRPRPKLRLGERRCRKKEKLITTKLKPYRSAHPNS